jgi:hypothetical protein
MALNMDNILNIIFIGLNLRNEIPVLNSKIKKLIKKGNINIYNYFNDNNYGFFIGNNIFDLFKLIASKSIVNLKLFSSRIYFNIFNFFNNFLNLNILFGLSFIKNVKNFSKNKILNYFNTYCKSLNCYNLLSNLAYISFFEIGLKYKELNINELDKNLIIMLNIDNDLFLNNLFFKRNSNNFFIYLGSYFDFAAKLSNLIFPINSFFEYNGLFVNFEGLVRKLVKIVNFNSNIYNSFDLFKSIFIFFNIKFLKFNFFFKIFYSIFNFFKYFFLN